jgi:hypothetical protein
MFPNLEVFRHHTPWRATGARVPVTAANMANADTHRAIAPKKIASFADSRAG